MVDISLYSLSSFLFKSERIKISFCSTKNTDSTDALSYKGSAVRRVRPGSSSSLMRASTISS